MQLVPRFLLGFLFFFFTLVIFMHLDDMSVEIYDEARRAVSASEMAAGKAHFLVPTYNGEPDHWGTKPALLVLCQAFWMKFFGVGELAVRLPSALATLALCFLMTWWGRKDWGGMLAGGVAALAMLCNWQFMGNHGARTGDFDAMLTLFLMAQVVFFYRWVVDDKMKWLWLAGGAVVLAGLTKGVAGGFFLPGIGLWLLLDAEGRKRLLRPSLYLVIGGAIGLVVSHYFIRETVDPGYLEFVQNNELGGRFSKTNEGHQHPFTFYFKQLVEDKAMGHLLALLVPAGLFFFWRFGAAAAGAKSVEERRGNLWAGRRPALLVAVVLVVFLLVISVAGTKLYWYKNPSLPLIGMLIGGFLFAIAGLLADRIGGNFGKVVAIGLLAALFIAPMSKVLERSHRPRVYQETPKRKLGFRDFMRHHEIAPPYTVVIRDYNPNARFYVNQAQSEGKDIQLKRVKKLLPPLVYNARLPGGFEVGERVMICHTETWDYLFKRYRMKEVFKFRGCKLMELGEERE